MTFIRINNVIIDRDKVTSLVQDPKNISNVRVTFDNGSIIVFEGAEASEVWKQFDDDKGWRQDDD